tara:strand:+ start:4585 stop:4983 length:399 start_codon:yes stop_codon:yes gene_type:complete
MSFLAHWNPNRDIFDTFTDSLFDGFVSTRPLSNTQVATNVNKTENGYDIQLAVPGVPKDQVKVDVKDNLVTVSYKQEEATTNSVATRSFSKSWTLPKNVDVENITAIAEDGILTVTVPKTEAGINTRSITVS